MTRRWFGTDGIRGHAGSDPLVPPFLRRLGQALAAEVGRGACVPICRDTRESGPAIAADLAAGLTAGGAKVLDLGVMPTAGMPMLMRRRGFPLGLVVSASHNPWQDNGVKVFGPGGLKLDDARERGLEARIEAFGDRDPGAGGEQPEQEDGAAAYRAEVLERIGELDLSGLSLVVDCAHGAASGIAPELLAGLGAEVVTLFDAPDGRNINAGCGSTHLEPLRKRTIECGADLGMAFDGDADRVLMVDRSGRNCHGDHMLGFLGSWLAERDELPGKTVVATVMSNLGLERYLVASGLRLERTPVGDRHVLAAMQAGGYRLGGEASGHLLVRRGDESVGDGLLTALFVLRALRETGRSLVEVVDDVRSVPHVLTNVPVAARPPLEELAGLTDAVSRAQQTHGDKVRIVLRYSGTERLARVMVEGLDDGVVQDLAAQLVELWPREIEHWSARQPARS